MRLDLKAPEAAKVKLDCVKAFLPQTDIQIHVSWGTRLAFTCYRVVPRPAPLSEPVFRWMADTDTSGCQYNTLLHYIYTLSGITHCNTKYTHLILTGKKAWKRERRPRQSENAKFCKTLQNTVILSYDTLTLIHLKDSFQTNTLAGDLWFFWKMKIYSRLDHYEFDKLIWSDTLYRAP